MRFYRRSIPLLLLLSICWHQVNAKTTDANRPVLPDTNKVALLVRTTLLTLNDAVQTGNFTVLRDRAAPAFASANSAAQLSKIFDNLAQSKFDLSLVSIVAPQLYHKPNFDEHGHLHLFGVFPGSPIQIEFDLKFKPVATQWRLISISVMPQHSQPVAKKESPTNNGQKAKVILNNNRK